MKRFFLLLLFFLLIPSVFAIDCKYVNKQVYPGDKAYKLSNAYIDMTILPDGMVVVKETITFDFLYGKFSFAYRDIEVDKENIFDVYVTENGEEVCYDYYPSYGRKARVKWYYNEVNGNDRTFTIHYKLKDVITVYDDYSDFYWKVWGDNWAVKLENLEGISGGFGGGGGAG